MAIPDFQSLMLPLLRVAGETPEVRIGTAIDQLADQYNLSIEDREHLLPSKRQATFANRVHWAKSYLNMAGLVRNTRRSYFAITDAGRGVIRNPPERIDIKFLDQFPGFTEKRAGKAGLKSPSGSMIAVENGSEPELPALPITPLALPPDEQLRALSTELDQSLGSELIERVLAAPPVFFERLVVQPLTAMGYGGAIADAGRALGKSGDDGVDGVIDEDPLGLDQIFVQAKRYKPGNAVGGSEIRDFRGSLDLQKASKVLFVTTSTFTPDAMRTARSLSSRIVLIDGAQLAKLMIRYDVGCRVEATFAIKRIDEDFFEQE